MWKPSIGINRLRCEVLTDLTGKKLEPSLSCAVHQPHQSSDTPTAYPLACGADDHIRLIGRVFPVQPEHQDVLSGGTRTDSAK